MIGFVGILVENLSKFFKENLVKNSQLQVSGIFKKKNCLKFFYWKIPLSKNFSIDFFLILRMILKKDFSRNNQKKKY